MANTDNVTLNVSDELSFTNEEIEEILAARNMPIVFDPDCPETTVEKAVKFQRVNPKR